MNKKTKIKQLLPNLLLLLFSVLMGLAVFEVYLRFAYRQKQQALIKKYQEIESADLSRKLCAQKSDNPDLIYTFIPNKCGANSHGYFDDEYSYEKPQATIRIVVIGDSVAQGLGLDQEDIFSKLLEKKLNTSAINQENNKQKFEIITLARSGYSTSQQLIVLENEALKYNPDLIIWSYVLNDPAHPVYHNANGELGRYFFQPNIHVFHLISSGIFTIKEALVSLSCDPEYHQKLHCVYWNDIKSNIENIGRISQKNEVPVLFLIHPIFEENKKFSDYSLVNLHRKLTDLADAEGLIPIDLLQAYKAYNPDDLKQQAEDPWHPNEKGHKVIADFIEQSLATSEIDKL